MSDERTSDQRTVLPVPDPTVLTTQQLYRELGTLRDTLSSEIAHQAAARDAGISTLRDVIETRIDDIDRATELLGVRIAQIVGSDEIDRRVMHLKEFIEEKFTSVAKQFVERDVRTEQAAIATKIAVDAALQAQKEAAGAQNEANTAAITKSEAATVKQMDGIQALINASTAALSGRISELKERLDRGEGASTRGQSERTEHRLDTGLVVTIISVLLAAASIAIAIIVRGR